MRLCFVCKYELLGINILKNMAEEEEEEVERKCREGQARGMKWPIKLSHIYTFDVGPAGRGL